MTVKEKGLATFFENVMIAIVESGPKFGLAFIMATFEHICETYELDKTETWEMLTAAVKQVNDNLGSMYDPEGLQVLDER